MSELQSFMQCNGLEFKDVAKILKVDRSTVSRWHHEKTALRSSKRALLINEARNLGYDVSMFADAPKVRTPDANVYPSLSDGVYKVLYEKELENTKHMANTIIHLTKILHQHKIPFEDTI